MSNDIIKQFWVFHSVSWIFFFIYTKVYFWFSNSVNNIFTPYILNLNYIGQSQLEFNLPINVFWIFVRTCSVLVFLLCGQVKNKQNNETKNQQQKELSESVFHLGINNIFKSNPRKLLLILIWCLQLSSQH